MGPVERIVAIDKAWRRRQDAFWKRVEQSPYGPFVYGAFLVLFVLIGLVLCYYALRAVSSGVVRGNGGTTYFAENPAWFSLRVCWMLFLGVATLATGALCLWKTVCPGTKKRSKRPRRASVKRPDHHD